MSSKKETKSKKTAPKAAKKISTKPVVAPIEENDEEDAVGVDTKSKSSKPIEIDVADALHETPDEKEVLESVAVESEEEESEDVPSLDAEDLNPFGDKWEE